MVGQYVVICLDDPGPAKAMLPEDQVYYCGGFGLLVLIFVNATGKLYVAWGYERRRLIAGSSDYRPLASVINVFVFGVFDINCVILFSFGVWVQRSMYRYFTWYHSTFRLVQRSVQRCFTWYHSVILGMFSVLCAGVLVGHRSRLRVVTTSSSYGY